MCGVGSVSIVHSYQYIVIVAMETLKGGQRVCNYNGLHAPLQSTVNITLSNIT